MNRRKLSKVVSVVSVNLALLGVMNLAFGQLGCQLAASDEQKSDGPAGASVDPRLEAATPDLHRWELIAMSPVNRATLERAFENDRGASSRSASRARTERASRSCARARSALASRSTTRTASWPRSSSRQP